MPPPAALAGTVRRLAWRLPPARHLEGLLLLLFVSLLWGSYSPTLRLAYSLPGPPSPAVLAAARGWLQLLILLMGLLFSQRAPPPPPAASVEEEEEEALELLGEAGRANEPARQPLLRDAGEERTPEDGVPTELRQQAEAEEAGWRRRRRSPLGLPAAVLASLEIGCYNTTGMLCQTAGLAMTTATRGAFLIQSSALFTPLLAACAGMAPSRAVWLGSLLALAGTVVIAADLGGRSGSHSVSASLGGWDLTAAQLASTSAQQLLGTQPSAPAATAEAQAPPAGLFGMPRGTPGAQPTPLGDVLILCAALCYSASTVRIPAWAVQRRVPPLHLALGKSAFLAVVSTAALGLVAAAALAGEAASPLAELWPGWRRPDGWLLIGWSALGPGALSALLHVKGQSLVSPTTAQIVFCTVPLWSALLAAALLPAEPVRLSTWLGGGLVAAAGLVAALGTPKQQAQQVERDEDRRHG